MAGPYVRTGKVSIRAKGTLTLGHLRFRIVIVFVAGGKKLGYDVSINIGTVFLPVIAEAFCFCFVGNRNLKIQQDGVSVQNFALRKIFGMFDFIIVRRGRLFFF